MESGNQKLGTEKLRTNVKYTWRSASLIFSLNVFDILKFPLTGFNLTPTETIFEK